MNTMQKLLGLLALAVVATLFYLQTGEQETDAPELVLPGLQDQLDAVAKVVVAGNGTATLVKGDDGWTVAEKSGYPANFASLASLLNGLAEAEIAELKTAKPERHAQLGLAAVGGAGEQGSVVSLYMDADADTDKPAFSLMVGKASPSGRGTFVRRPDEAQTYLATGELDVPADSSSWVDEIVINIDSTTVQKVELGSDSDSKALVAERGDNGMEIVGLPIDAELRYPTVADNLARALVNVRLEDVEAYQPDEWSGAALAIFELTDGSKVEARTRKQDARPLLHLTIEPAENSDLANQTEKSSWQYQIPDYNYDQLNKTLADMLKEEETDG